NSSKIGDLSKYCVYIYVISFYSCSLFNLLSILFFFFMIRRPPRSTLFPTRRSSDLCLLPSAFCLLFYGILLPLKLPLQTDSLKRDRKSTRLNSSHLGISYAVFCLKKKKQLQIQNPHHSSTST